MPKRPKSGPPYTDIPDEVYVVVSHPWGMNPLPRERGQNDFDRVASWAQLVLKQGGLGGGHAATIECIYSMGTRNEIIIQFEEGTDIIPLLGEHRWAKISRQWTGPPDDHRATRVFLYNWRDNGDPANHNWSEKYPRRLAPGDVPAKSPYPAPSWTAPPASLVNLVLPIPRPPNPPPVPEQGDVPHQEQPATTLLPSSMVTPAPAPPGELAQSTDLFRPYEPPSQHPSHGLFLNQLQEPNQDASPSQSSPPPPKFIKKLDPYELEEDALSILRAPDPVQEDTKDVKHKEVNPTLALSIKAEPPEVKVEDRPNFPPRKLPPASLGYQPTAELAAYIAAHLRGATAPASSSPPGGGAQPAPSLARVTVKREYEEDVVIPLGKSKRIKVEES